MTDGFDPDRPLFFERDRLERHRAETEARRTGNAAARPAAAEYLHDPVGWTGLALPTIELADYQKTAMRSLVKHKRHAVRGPHGLGKSFTSAATCLWFGTTSEAAGLPWKIGSTASAWRQLTKFLWPEIRALAKLLDWDALGMVPWVRHEQLLDLSIKLEWGEAFAAASNVPENLEGLHARRVLYLYDEAKIIPPKTWEATEGAFSTAGEDTDDEAYALAVSTPGAPAGVFYNIHKRRPGYEDWSVQHVTSAEAIAAGRISAEWYEQRRRQWGEKSAVFLNRCEGEFAADDEKSVIPLAWVEAAIDRWHEWRDAADKAGGVWPTPSRMGVDVARHGADETVIASIHGDTVLKLDRRPFTDNVVSLADEVSQIAPTAEYAVDADGMGAGTADQLRRLRGSGRVTVFHGAPRPEGWRDRSGELEAFNTRAAAWWSLRERLDPAFGSKICLPPDDLLIGDLTGPERVYDGGNRIKLEKKETTAARLGRSPDAGDAVVIGLWVPPPEMVPEEWVPGKDWASEAGGPGSAGLDWGARPAGVSGGHAIGGYRIGVPGRGDGWG